MCGQVWHDHRSPAHRLRVIEQPAHLFMQLLGGDVVAVGAGEMQGRADAGDLGDCVLVEHVVVSLVGSGPV